MANKRAAAALLGMAGGLAAVLVGSVVVFLNVLSVGPTHAENMAMYALSLSMMCSLLGALGGLVSIAKPRAGGIVMLLGGIGGLVLVGAGFVPFLIQETGWVVPVGFVLVAQVMVVVGGRRALQIGSENGP